MRLIDVVGSYTVTANDNTGYSLGFCGGIISVADDLGRILAEFDADDAPTIDAVPVVHGRWIWNKEYECVVCSNCEMSALKNYCGNYAHSNFCPNCGARMDGE